ncbi:uncharacterized protein PHACADRAFT_182134 [Phanerochaete carnosa HHB-10118-sp]|uniref:F-box domain-containing protein n=1 Tax=Phanerochaete carnosa (strain HHB-10118-sp) TaxID=650164 RepID=K5V4U3_PHACS|nr:uncharacterized protein PHACADRAFT_182134 [Phanerochaete carnosa HHB-10118-sp]EKM57651.1 hypothetical protein PHACADRAFT_182134 [Phanerochaete carnosa HHB-10118-sp]
MTELEDAEQTQLLASIATWERQIAAAKRRLNELRPIGKLPSELLCEVFMHRSADWRVGDRTWIEVSRVCYRWREAALNYPALWGQIMPHTYKWTRELLLRSEQSALDVATSDYRAADKKDIIVLLRQLHRLRSIDWSLYYEINAPDLPRVAPFLRSVALCDREVRGHGPSATPFDNIEAPLLTHLEIVCIPVSWTSRLFRPTLTHLKFCVYYEGPRPIDISMLEVLGLLQTMPQLQSLELADALPDSGTAGIGANVHVRFPQLCFLRVKERASIIRYFLEHISFSKDIDISIEFSNFQLDRENMEQSMRLLASLFASDAHSKDVMRPLRSLSHSRHAAKAWTRNQELDNLFSPYLDRTAASRPFHHDRRALAVRAPALMPDSCPTLFEMFCRSLPLAEVRSAYIDMEWMNNCPWQNIYESMPHICELGVAGRETDHTFLIESLATASTTTDALRPLHCDLPVYMFPELQVLSLHRLYLLDDGPCLTNVCGSPQRRSAEAGL